MPIRERIVIESDDYGRLLVEREPAPDMILFAGTGPARGDWEDAQGTGVVVEYIPPPAS